MSSHLMQPDGTKIEVDFYSRATRNDNRNVVVPVRVLRELVAYYYTGGGEADSYDERLFDVGYYDQPIIPNKGETNEPS